MSSAKSFADLDLHPELLKALTGLGYEEPTPIQAESIGPLLAGRDLLGQASTGTGKTAAFALPMLQRIAKDPGNAKQRTPRGLVLVPTRELAMQVSEAMHKYGQGVGARVLPVYGGQPIVRQLKALQRGVDVVVATPGRALDHISRRSLILDHLQVVVLDEADEMLDMGFSDDIETILAAGNTGRQTVLFSATMPKRIAGLAKRHLNDPVRIELAREQPADGQSPRVRQTAYVVNRAHKSAALTRVLDHEEPKAAIVFCRTRAEVDDITVTLNGRGYSAEALHGGIDQQQRSRVVERLKSGATELVVATDVAARGLDVDVLTHVVNYDVPAAPEAYVHRIGRVGRAGREGVAITFAQPREHRILKAIEKLTGQKIEIEQVPTVADLHARRLELTRAGLRESILADDLAPMRTVVEGLAEEFDLMSVALAAVKLAHEASGSTADEEDIPQAPPPSRNGRDRGDFGRERDRGKPAGKGQRPRLTGPTTRLFIGAGRAAHVRPQDLVGAITGESPLSGSDIGTIQIHERFSLVEVPSNTADVVIKSLKQTTIKGRKPQIRREGARPR